MEVTIPLRPLIIHVPEERREIYERIKRLLDRCEWIINSTDDEKIQLRAMECAVKIAGLLKDVLKDVQLDELEKTLDELERAIEKS
ncbi:MAG: hypothetical protein QW424_05310 [Candidatus Bathyarchaeia archaeon]